jgi:hypothetical protein
MEDVISRNITKVKQAMDGMCSKLISLIVITIAGVLVVKGADLLRYETIALQQVVEIEAKPDYVAEQNQTDSPSKLHEQAGSVVKSFGALASAAGVSSQARDNIWRALSRSFKHNEVVEKALIDFLKVAPTSGWHWAELAGTRFIRDAPFSQTLAALQMSDITEPREQNTLVSRTRWYLMLWDRLPYDTRRRRLDELASLDGCLDAESVQRLKLVLTRTSEGIRQALRNDLIERKGANKAWLKALGL